MQLLLLKKKQNKSLVNNPEFVSPISKKAVIKKMNFYYCQEDGYAFPIIHGIPCLTKNNAILISKFSEFVSDK